MPQDLRLRVGNEVATITLNGTAQQCAAILDRFLRSWDITPTGNAVTDMTATLEKIRVEVIRRSKEKHTAELRLAGEASIQATVDAENGL